MNTVKKYNTLFFYIFTFLLTGIFFFVPSLLFPNNSFPFFQLPPAIVAFAMIAALGKAGGIRDFGKSLFPAGVNLLWLPMSTLLPAALIFSATIAEGIASGQGFDASGTSVMITPGFVLMILAGCIGEEIGFRGYLLPLLLKQHGNLASAIILSILWGLWHAAYYGEGLGFLFFVVGTVALSVIMTWLYHKSKGNIIAAVLFHFCVNFCATIMPESGVPNTTSRAIYATVSIVPAACWC